MITTRTLVVSLLAALSAGCAHRPPEVSASHLRAADQPPVAAASAIPAPVLRSQSLPPPRALAEVETYNVVVNNVPASELLFALARDARLNVDVHPAIQGNVTINALDQTLPQILERVAKQVPMRYELADGNLSVMPDTPYLQLYQIDYLNMARDSVSKVSIATEVAAPGGIGGAGSSSDISNSSSTELTNTQTNHFWENLTTSVRDLLREEDRPVVQSATLVGNASVAYGATTAGPAAALTPPAAAAPAAAAVDTTAANPPTPSASAELSAAASVIAHPETGTLAVRANSLQQRKVREFLDQLMDSAQRQVLIEATVVEVELSDGYQQGIDWNVLRQSNSRFQLTQEPSGGVELPGGSPVDALLPALGVLSHVGALGSADINLNIRLLESFGRTKVLSSPKISVLNNQTALIKVVDNLVYFTLTVDAPRATVDNPNPTVTVQSIPNTVPVGFLMNVTPQVGSNDEVSLNLRPTISRLNRYVQDPGVALILALARQGGGEIPEIASLVPEIQTREMESIIKVRDGQTAVLGGLMRDRSERKSDGVPGLAGMPWVGNLFKYRNEQGGKSELVIFLRPTIIRDPSLQGDYRGVAERLPDNGFFDSVEGASDQRPSTAAPPGAQP